jgi:3-dehydroquinate synthase
MPVKKPVARAAVWKERVALEARSYDITIGPGALESAGELIGRFANRTLVVTNRRVDRLHGGGLYKSLDKAGVRWGKTLLPEGERHKNMASVAKVHDALARGGYGRDCVVAGFGGGVVGDVAGFAAATYMRGVMVAQIPTTLLAQVDSSVGGKTGVNHPAGKNMIGSFHQPCLVLADISVLGTLPRMEILCGVAEVIKYGAIASEDFFGYLEQNIEKLLRLEPETTVKAVRTSCRIKADVVSSDELESGRRAILNFGHTVGHAIEAVTGYKAYRHGYAVAMGMAVAATLSWMKGGLKAEDSERIKSLVRRAGLPAAVPGGVPVENLLKAMEMDKKVKAGRIRFALLPRLGECIIRDDVTLEEIRIAVESHG